MHWGQVNLHQFGARGTALAAGTLEVTADNVNQALQALMNIFMDADAAADVLGQTTPQGMVDAIRRHF